jgi:MFS family permease
MAAATGAMGLLRTWAGIGVVASISLVILRLLQGFSSGGQLATSITFLTEFAPDGATWVVRRLAHRNCGTWPGIGVKRGSRHRFSTDAGSA